MKPKTPKLQPGDLVSIRFLDHAENDSPSETELDFIVYGRVVESDRRKIVLDSWAYHDPHIPTFESDGMARVAKKS